MFDAICSSFRATFPRPNVVPVPVDPVPADPVPADFHAIDIHDPVHAAEGAHEGQQDPLGVEVAVIEHPAPAQLPAVDAAPADPAEQNDPPAGLDAADEQRRAQQSGATVLGIAVVSAIAAGIVVTAAYLGDAQP